MKKIYGSTGLLSEKKTPEVLYIELKEGAEAATSSHSAAGHFLQDIYSVIMAKNNQKIGSRCLIH